MLMYKNHKNTAITISIIIILFTIILIIVASNFFTNDNLKKYTIAKEIVACKYTEKIFEEPVEQVQISKVQESNATKSKETTTEKTNSNNTSTTTLKKTNSSNTSTTTSENTTQKNSLNSEKTKTNENSNVKSNEAQTKAEQSKTKTNSNSKQTTVVSQYQGLSTIGKIEIPKTGVNMPILSKVTVKGMEIAPCLLYSTGTMNISGNHLIVGHNYNNIFSKNKNLQIGDKIYITTLDGNRLQYTIYNKFFTSPEDMSYMKRDTNNQPEITLSTCTEDDNTRLILSAKIVD